MATRYIGITDARGYADTNNEIVGAAAGGTLAGSQTVQVVFDDGVFGSPQEQKQRLVAALQQIIERVQTAKEWPISSAS